LRRALAGLVLLLAVCAVSGCESDDPVFPRTGTLLLQVLDRTLGSQLGEERTNQYEKWTVSRAEVEVAGLANANVLVTMEACTFRQLNTVDRNCFTGIALDAGAVGTATVRVEVIALEVIRATRPELTGDVDKDGVPDVDDNCPYFPNPDQENENEGEEGENPVGDACTTAGGANDSDADTVPDFRDNCVYVANPLQENEDSVYNIGDACEERVVVTLPAGGAVIHRTDQAFTIREQGHTILLLDFRSNEWCGHGTMSCMLDPEDVVLTVQ
jgi:hypothetical protein